MPSVHCGFVCTSQHHHFRSFQGLKLQPFWNIKEATVPKVKNIPTSSGLWFTPEADVIWLPSPSSHGKHSTSSGTCWLPNPRDASRSSSWCLFWKIIQTGNHSSLFHSLSPWFPEQNLVLTFALFSRKLLGAARCFSFHLPFPHILSPGRQVEPTMFH